VRMADATVPMDEALANVAIDLSGRVTVFWMRNSSATICEGSIPT